MNLSKTLHAIILSVILVGCSQKETQVEVSSVSLNTSTVEMVEGETFNLVATVLPKDAEYDGVTWTSSNASVASVNSGTVKALKEGISTITASTEGKSSTCSVTVHARVIPVTSITLNKSSLSMTVGDKETLMVTVKPEDATYKDISWSSSDESIVKVDNGTVSALKAGSATIMAKCGYKTAACPVAVSAKVIPVTSITLDKSSLSMTVGDKETLTATVKPEDATYKDISWSSSDESIVKVDNGTVSALKAGSATIMAKCGYKTAACPVAVSAKVIPVTSITLDKSSLSMTVGDKETLTATVKPEDATYKDVSWSSSDESVVKIDNGIVTAVNTGNATITARCGDKFAECVVDVISPDIIITYTTNNGKVVSINNENVFGATIVSNEYANGVGRIIFDGPVTSVGKTAFMDCTNLTSMKLPDSVIRIGVGAFKGCTKLKTINTPSSLSDIDAEAFSNCNVLSFFSLPEGISKIENNTFYMCHNLVIDRIPSSVTAIGNSAFVWDYALERLVLPNGVVSVGESAFWGSGIKELELPNSLTAIDHWGFFDIKVEKLTIPGSLETIKNGMFSSDCLTEITIEEGTKIIDNKAFSGNEKLKKVVFPSSIKTIFPGIFEGCISFSDLYIKAMIPPATYLGSSDIIYDRTNSAFGADIDFNIWVPRSSVETYKNNFYWSKYKDHIKANDF